MILFTEPNIRFKTWKGIVVFWLIFAIISGLILIHEYTGVTIDQFI